MALSERLSQRRRAIRLLGATLRAERRSLGLCAAAGMAWQSVVIAVPWVLERAIDDGVVGSDRAALVGWCIALVALGFVGWAGEAGRHWLVERTAARAGARLRRLALRGLLQMTDDEVSRTSGGEFTTRCLSDTATIQDWIAGLATLVTSLFTLVTVSALLFRLDAALTGVGLAVVPVVAVCSLAQVRPHRDAASAAADAVGKYSSAVQASIIGIATVKGLGAEHEVSQMINRRSDTVRAGMQALGRREADWLSTTMLIPSLGIATGLWVGGERVVDGSMSVGSLVVFFGWMSALAGAGETLTRRLTDLGHAIVAAARLVDLVVDEPAARHHPSPQTFTSTTRPVPTIELRGVSVRRGSALVVIALDHVLAAGSWTAVLGASGSGKTSLLRVIAGLDVPAAGVIRGVTPANMTLVPQNARLVGGTLRDVVRLGSPDASDAEIGRAIAAVDALDVIDQIGGLDGSIDDRGASLSGGQRQRIALAAAILRRPSLLVLDDTMSALDAATECRVLAGVRRFLPSTTVLIATHRSTTAAACEAAIELVPPTPR